MENLEKSILDSMSELVLSSQRKNIPTKPPNILILCENKNQRLEIRTALKKVVSNERYIIYDIHWEELNAGGWSKNTGLLVLAGKVPNEKEALALLQFLGDGGKLMTWSCDNPPFGPSESTTESITSSLSQKTILYGPEQQEAHNLTVSNHLWPSAGGKHPPPAILEAVNSEGRTTQMSASAYGSVKDTNEMCIVELDGGTDNGKAILSQIHFEKSTDNDTDAISLLSFLLTQKLGIDCTQVVAPEYTPGFLLGDKNKVMDFIKVTPSIVKQSKLTLKFISVGEQGPMPSQEYLPIRQFEQPKHFCTEEYFHNLTTKELGRLVIYTNVTASTMNVVSGNFLGHGLVAIAARQTTARGRGKNIWLSPEGCACFTLQLSMHMDSVMGSRISLLQHISGLAVVLSVPNHKKLGLRVKWPNDIYVNDTKIGGVLVESQISGRNIVVNAGIGVNVSNAYPATSLNYVIQKNAGDPSCAPVLSSEKFIAGVLSEFEKLLDLMESNFVERVINLYTDNWMHGSVEVDSKDQEVVSVEISKGNFTACKIVGIDEYGFLRVKKLDSGEEFTVRPDGNSFDIANKLISIKL